MGPIRNPRWEQERTEGYVIVSTARSTLYFDLHLKIDKGWLRTKLYDNREDFNFELSISYTVATFQQHLHMEHISLCWSYIPELVVSIMISLKLIEDCC